MRKILLPISIFLGMYASAQETKVDLPATDTLKAWSIQAQNTLMLNQAAFSNWVGGGANNVGWLAGVNYNLTYEKANIFGKTLLFWDMDKIILKESEHEKLRMSLIFQPILEKSL